MCIRYTQLKTRIEKAKQRTLPIAYHHPPWGFSFAQPVFLSFHVKWRILLSICYQVSKCGFPTSTTHKKKKKRQAFTRPSFKSQLYQKTFVQNPKWRHQLFPSISRLFSFQVSQDTLLPFLKQPLNFAGHSSECLGSQHSENRNRSKGVLKMSLGYTKMSQK